MQEEILTLARALSGDETGELLALLCEAAQERLRRRLREGICPTDCHGAFVSAAACEATADWMEGQCGGEGMASYTAGAVSVHARAVGETLKVAKALRQQALRLLVPYTVDEGFCFCGVRA